MSFVCPRPADKPHSVKLKTLVFSPVTIYLGRTSQPASVQPTRDSNGASSTLSLLGLAPDGGCLAVDVTTRAGGLLLANQIAGNPIRSSKCFAFATTFSPLRLTRG